MSVGTILKVAGNKMGQDPSNPEQRQVLLRFLNEAAREVYTQCDPPGSLMEECFKVNGDQTISMPYYVGKVRGVRELTTKQAWHVNRMRPRYNQFNWKDAWRNIRLKNKQALQATVVNESKGRIVVSKVENPPIIVSVTGPTPEASSISESITMDQLVKETENTFLNYTAVKKNRVNTVDVQLQDVDGNVLTTIPNNMKEAQYQIFDVSTFPYLSQNVNPLNNYLEVLFKLTLPYLENDEDEFPAFDYDDILINKMMQLWKEEQDKIDAATAYDAKATRTMARVQEDQNRETEDKVSLVAHPHDTLHGRIGTRRWHFTWRRQ